MADPLNVTINNARVARREARLDDACEEYQKAVSLCRRDGKKGTLIVALKGLAQIERHRGNSDAALQCYLEAVTIARELDDELALPHTIRHLADLYQDIGNLDSAESCYIEALALYRADSRTAPLELANAIRPMALLLEKLSRINDARKLWEEAGRLYTTAAVDEGVGECQRAIQRCT